MALDSQFVQDRLVEPDDPVYRDCACFEAGDRHYRGRVEVLYNTAHARG